MNRLTRAASSRSLRQMSRRYSFSKRNSFSNAFPVEKQDVDIVFIRIILLLVNKEFDRKEVLLYELEVTNETVGDLIDKIPNDAKDEMLRNQEYDCVCKQNSVPLNKSTTLRHYFASRTNALPIVVAIPSGNDGVAFAQAAFDFINIDTDLCKSKVKKEEFEDLWVETHFQPEQKEKTKKSKKKLLSRSSSLPGKKGFSSISQKFLSEKKMKWIKEKL